MDPITGAAVAQGAGSILGGISSFFGGGAKKPPTMRQQRMQQQALDEQRPSWIVKGAKNAGIHPLTALGSPVASPASFSFGGGGSEPSTADKLYNMGQGIQGAVNAYQSREEKQIMRSSQVLGVENQQLQNEFLRAQIQQMRPVGRPDGMSINPAMSGTNMTGFDGKLSSDASMVKTRNGDNAVVPSESVKAQIEDMIVPEMQWMIRQFFSAIPDGKFYNPFTSTIKDMSPSMKRRVKDGEFSPKKHVSDLIKILTGKGGN